MHKNFHPAKRFSMLILCYPLLVSNPKVEQNLALVLDEYFIYTLYSYITVSVIIIILYIILYYIILYYIIIILLYFATTNLEV